jgi:hypothetical protein
MPGKEFTPKHARRNETEKAKSAVEKLKSISPSEGIPQEVRETMRAVGEMFDRELPPITSGALLSTRIKSKRH